MDKIPLALFTSRFGGTTLAHHTRKFNFMKAGADFLRNIVSQIGKPAGEGEVTSVAESQRDSGTLTFKSPVLTLELTEDKVKQDGVKLKYEARDENTGKVVAAGVSHIKQLNQKSNLAILIDDLKTALRTTKPMFLN